MRALSYFVTEAAASLWRGRRSAILAVLTLLTLGYFGPIILLGLGIFLVIGLQYLIWGWWFERIYRSGHQSDDTNP